MGKAQTRSNFCQRVLLCSVMTLCALPLQAKTCTAKQADAADRQIDQLDSWIKIDGFIKQFGHCDDGSIAEGASEAVARLLVDQWATLPTLARLSKRNRNLMPFVLRHLDATLDADDLEKISQLSMEQCPESANTLCASLTTQLGKLAKY